MCLYTFYNLTGQPLMLGTLDEKGEENCQLMEHREKEQKHLTPKLKDWLASLSCSV